MRARGFKISLDDFGTGFSSLQHVVDLPLDEIKLDRGFIDKVNLSDTHKAVVLAIQTLAKESGISLIAEGISSYRLLEKWKEMGGTRIQGFQLSPALPEDSFFTWAPYLIQAPRLC